MGKSKKERETSPHAVAWDRHFIRCRASARASATSADIEALELPVLLRHGLVGTCRRHIPGLALLGRRPALVLRNRRRALVLLSGRTGFFLLGGLSGQTLLDKSRKMNGAIFRDFDVGRGAAHSHGRDRRIDLHVSGLRPR